ncbi:nutrient deprivation-induced protein [Rhizobium wenxiniae]|uniref:Xanthine/uracil permease n=1 Tax=Rhizobium wenxiniae TaxID=1737357 RepID=A0A7W9Y9T0_9HYPH|nr:phage holin family protein [Rhizobium wenxiniae]MBB6164615.1 xanthine/uracil permease [Rhizobium wenxiniae]GGG07039.1 nutrient deprivation-induced protein [Rhizobium wenxiniae]
MAKSSDERSLPELVTGLVGDISGLFRKEINLAKTEASEKMTLAMVGVEAFAAGLVLAICAVGVLLAALVNGLAAFLVARGMAERNADALSSVVVGVVVALVAWGLISRGLNAIKGEKLKLERTSASLQQDAKIVKDRT